MGLPRAVSVSTLLDTVMSVCERVREVSCLASVQWAGLCALLTLVHMGKEGVGNFVHVL